MLLAARHKAGKNIAACAKECGLSRTFLTMIEIGKRCPELERVPAIGLAYQANVSELCWAWVCQWAPAAVRYLSLSVDLELVPTIVEHFHRAWVKRQAEEAAVLGVTVEKMQADRLVAAIEKRGTGKLAQ
jgi:lambda repressor-like predicted transcriptional regulator